MPLETQLPIAIASHSTIHPGFVKTNQESAEQSAFTHIRHCTSYLWDLAKDPVPQDAQSGVIYKKFRAMTVTAICEAVEEVTGSMPEETWTSSVHRGLQHISTCWTCQVTGHEIDWSNATVLDSCQFYYQQSYFESWHIHPITSQILHFTITLQASQFSQIYHEFHGHTSLSHG